MSQRKYPFLLSSRMRFADVRGRGVYAGWPDENNAIFIHIPKTAGTSVSRTLGIVEARHANWEEYHYANPRKFSKYYKFAFVRNPWDRLVSAYSYLRQGGNSEADRRFSESVLSNFQDFRHFVIDGLHLDEVRSWVHFRPQVSFICRGNGELVVDRVFRFEKIEEHALDLSKKLFGEERKIEKINVSDREGYESYFDAVTSNLVSEYYRKDIEMFKYRFKG